MPFDGKSTYRDNYHTLNPIDYNTPIKAKDNLQTDSKVPFNSQSHYKEEFLPYSIEKNNNYHNRNKETHIVRPEQVGKQMSNYKNCYPMYGPEYYTKIECPMKYLPAPPRYLSPGKNHIVYSDELNNWD